MMKFTAKFVVLRENSVVNVFAPGEFAGIAKNPVFLQVSGPDMLSAPKAITEEQYTTWISEARSRGFDISEKRPR